MALKCRPLKRTDNLPIYMLCVCCRVVNRIRCMCCVRSNVWFACFCVHSSVIHRNLFKWPMKMRWHTHFQCARQTFKRITFYQAHSKRKLHLPSSNVAKPPTSNGKLSAIVLLRRYANRSFQNLFRSMLPQIPRAAT